MPVLQSVHPALRQAPAPRLSAIRPLAERCGVRDGALRTALSRACAAGSLEVVDGRYRLGPASREEAAAARALMARISGYTLCVVLEGEAADLPALRDLFARYGFRPLQRSVWVGARTTEDLIGPALRRTGLAQGVIVFRADEVDPGARDRLSAIWGLRARTTELRQFHRQLLDYIDAADLAPAEAAWRCVQAAPTWYRIAVQGEPPFPRDLCGADYPLDALNAAWRARVAALDRELVDLWSGDDT
ncbi:hypothetical protein [Phenylobacterium aquaticum]|uniref:hypothetical protein n=1 Tax=Phenylobacterium aquaticum TaxID=1763816 RepID=UPI001F5C9C4A|nr:hypothetical protein [Phenylobacterium aquaticum]MCI3134727.1 hypothetical protein [Phenylobacterium aquaticum]